TVWSPSDLGLAQTAAGTVAGAIETARLFNEELKQRLLAESLNEVANVLTGSLDLSIVVNTIFEQLKRVLDYDGAAIFLHDEDDLVEAQAVGISARYVGYRFLADSNGPQIEIFRARQAKCIPDTANYENWTPVGGNFVTRSWMGAPLIIGDEILGILTMSHTRSK